MIERNFGSDPEGGFNEFSRAYKESPSIENYVNLRRSNPEAEIEISVIGGLEQFSFMHDELESYGIDPALILDAMDADNRAVSELCLRVMEKMIEARELAAAGETHLVRRGLAIPGKLIDWIINCSLDALSWNDDLEIPRDLIVLIRERLGGSMPAYEQASRAHEMKRNAAMIAGQLTAQGIKPTLAILGATLGVSASTVKRWFDKGELERESEKWARLFDEKGELRPLQENRPDTLRPK